MTKICFSLFLTIYAALFALISLLGDTLSIIIALYYAIFDRLCSKPIRIRQNAIYSADISITLSSRADKNVFL